MAKKKRDSPCTGLWHIVSMEAWDEDYIHEEAQAFIEFEDNGTGHIKFGYVQGQIDCRTTDRDENLRWNSHGKAVTALMERR
jgi:hypothetical protein